MKEITKIKHRYFSQPELVRDYMYDLIDQLVIDFGEINPSWMISLDMVCDWYRVFVDAKKSIADNGLTYKNSHGTIIRNPAFTALSTSSTQIQQILRSFAANPYQKSKMKSLDPEVRREDDYIRSIMEN